MSAAVATQARRGFMAIKGQRNAPIIARAARSYVWAKRVLPGGPGWHPAPACLFYPCPHMQCAALFAERIAKGLGWSVWVQRGDGGSSVWLAATGQLVPAVVKVRLPGGLSAKAAHAQLWPLWPAFQSLV